MVVAGHPEGRIVGHVQVQVASRVYSVPVESAPLEGSTYKAGFFRAADGFGILVDSRDSDARQRETILNACEEAAAYISRKLLN